MRSSFKLAGALVALGVALGGHHASQAADQAGIGTETWAQVPMPPGFKVVPTELEGPVFADTNGHTIYKWPQTSLRNGYAGDPKDKATCEDKVTTKTGGYMSPYPPDLGLPDLDKRKSCLAEWPAVKAPDDAKPVGKFTVVTRSDGSKQWAYDNHALYISTLDKVQGDVNGGTNAYRNGGDNPAERSPVGPPSDVPPGFQVHTTVRGRMLVTDKRYSVYSWDNDGKDKSNCHDDCNLTWVPVAAPESAKAHGEWTVVESAPGVRQWAFRHKPLYTYARDTVTQSQDGSYDNPGWHNVYTQLTPAWPKQFAVQDSLSGEVLADAKGMSVYIYTCGDDSADQLSCDLPNSPKAYFQAICGGFDKDRCARLWHFIPATAGEKTDNHLWSVLTVNAKTGDYAKAGEPDAVSVWAYRGRPLYTYAEDKQPGDYKGNGVGEWQGRRNGFRAFWVRNEVFGGG